MEQLILLRKYKVVGLVDFLEKCHVIHPNFVIVSLWWEEKISAINNITEENISAINNITAWKLECQKEQRDSDLWTFLESFLKHKKFKNMVVENKREKVSKCLKKKNMDM